MVRINWPLALSFWVGICCLSACEKAENYYETLHDQPEILLNYDAVYGIGDTLTLDGRLGLENDLKVTIGDAWAEIIAHSRIVYTQRDLPAPDTIDRIKVLITREMGLGADRPVTISSSGGTASGTAIEIVESSSQGYLPRALQIVKVTDYPSGALPLYCQNGKGSIYLWMPNKTISKISKDGSVSTVLDAQSLTDAEGSFTIVRFNAGGVDPQERYLYFSAITTDGAVGNEGNEVYRFCRYDLRSGALTTLNRSLFPTAQQHRTLEVFRPFEGNIGAVKLQKIAGIYPADNGSAFLWLADRSLMARLSSSGELRYQVRVGGDLPRIYDTEAGSYYSSSYVRSIIPGVSISTLPTSTIRAVAPEENMLYAGIGPMVSNITQIDLVRRVQIYSLTPPYLQLGSGHKPYISGSFAILTGAYDLSGAPGLFGYLPLPDEKVLILYYQMANRNRYPQLPALATLNFTDRVGRRYAPGRLESNGYIMQESDRMLNHDEEGMIYMTANDNSVIVKTQFQ